MQCSTRTCGRIARLAMVGVSLAALAMSAGAAEYKMTVNKDRLINAQNEPQNWLMMNGDYGSPAIRKLTQINRDNVKNLRMVWAMALGGMQDVGQNGPENEVNPLIDNGFMYTTDGWGTVYKIDARNPAITGEFVWMADPGVKHAGQRAAHARHRAVGRQGVSPICPTAASSRSIATAARSCGTSRSPTTNEFGTRGTVLSPRRSSPKARSSWPNGAGDGGTRGWIAALDAKTGNELWRWYVVPEARRPGQRDLEGQEQRLEDGRRRHLADRLLRSGDQAHDLGHRQSGADVRSAVAAGRQPLHQLGGRAGHRIPASSHGTSSIRRTTRGTTTRSASTCSTTQ